MMNTSYPESEATSPGHPGEALRAAREGRNWLKSDVAMQLHLSTDALTYLETGQFDKLPGLTFARGYVRAYAKLLGLDQNQLVHDFDVITGSTPVASNLHSLGRIEEPSRLSRTMLRAGVVVLLLIMIGAGALWWQERYAATPQEQAARPIEHVEVESADGSTQIHPLDELEDQAVEAAQVPIDLLAGEPAPLASVEAEPIEEAPVEETPVAVADDQGTLVLQFTEECWTRVADADGKVLASALKRPGETLEVRGKAPLEVRLGYARGVQVSYNGENVNVVPFMRGQTATLKLGQ
jgi:cytoskeleton protein RodZ